MFKCVNWHTDTKFWKYVSTQTIRAISQIHKLLPFASHRLCQTTLLWNPLHLDNICGYTCCHYLLEHSIWKEWRLWTYHHHRHHRRHYTKMHTYNKWATTTTTSFCSWGNDMRKFHFPFKIDHKFTDDSSSFLHSHSHLHSHATEHTMERCPSFGLVDCINDFRIVKLCLCTHHFKSRIEAHQQNNYHLQFIMWFSISRTLFSFQLYHKLNGSGFCVFRNRKTFCSHGHCWWQYRMYLDIKSVSKHQLFYLSLCSSAE